MTEEGDQRIEKRNRTWWFSDIGGIECTLQYCLIRKKRVLGRHCVEYLGTEVVDGKKGVKFVLSQ